MPQTTDTVKKTKKWLTIASLISGGVGAIMTPLLVMYVEFAPQIKAARGEAAAGYETMVPAVVELQQLLKESQGRIGQLDREINNYATMQRDIDRRVIRCEVYMETLGQKRNLPKPPSYEGMADGAKSASPPRDLIQQKPQYILPDKIEGAKKRARARSKLDCAPSDPLCGSID